MKKSQSVKKAYQAIHAALVSEHSCTKGFISRLPRARDGRFETLSLSCNLYTNRREFVECIGKKIIKVGMGKNIPL